MNNPDLIILYRLLKNYVHHARKIHAKSRKELYRTEPRLKAIDDCLRYLNAFQPGSPAFANIIPHITPQLNTILPGKTNRSYQSSLQKLNEIVKISQKIKNDSGAAGYKSEYKQVSE